MEAERRFEGRLLRQLHPWYSEIAGALLDSGLLAAMVRQAHIIKSIRGNSRQKRKLANDFVASAINPLLPIVLESPRRQRVVHILRLNSFRAYDLGAVLALRLMGFHATSSRVRELERSVSKQATISFDLRDHEIIEALENRAIVIGRGISAAIIADARSIIRDHLYLGNDDVFEVSQRIALGSGIPDWRALRIARTETQIAFNQATYTLFDRSGVPSNYWITVGDERVRDTHAENEIFSSTNPVPLGTPFPSGQLHPGDPGPHIDNINCRCSLQPNLEDTSLLLDPWSGGSGFFLKTLT